jgi:hypothetical protein
VSGSSIISGFRTSRSWLNLESLKTTSTAFRLPPSHLQSSL